MRLLWVTNIPFAHHNDLLGKKNAMVSGGAWLNAAYNSTVEEKENTLSIVTSCNVDKIRKGTFDGNDFYLLPGGDMHVFDYADKKNIENCRDVLKESNPDLVVLWGTESKLSYLFSELSTVPVLVYIQGLVTTIYRHYEDGIPAGFLTFVDTFNRIKKTSRLNIYKEQSYLEQKILKKAQGVVVENDWCEDQCHSINPELTIYRNKLPIREAAFQAKWDIDRIERHSIFTNAGSYPIKGHHLLFQAVAQVKRIFPDVKVYVPGQKYLENSSFLAKRSGFIKFIRHIIDCNNLWENIIFTGPLGGEEMISRIIKCNVYVMPSVVENHSASLIEAMVVGAPCISSLVGGVGTLIENMKDGIIYNYLDVESLAGNIIRVFKDDELAKRLAMGTSRIREERKSDFGKEMSIIYQKVIFNS